MTRRSEARKRTAEKPSLSRDRVVRAAVGLADQRGLEAVSMRNLARALRSKPMTLYFHVSNKDDLFSGIVDLIVGDFEFPGGEGDWRAEIRRSLVSAHRTLMRHPWACGLMLAATSSSARLRYTEALLKRLREAGFSALMTHRAYHILDSHLVGFTLWEAGYAARRDLGERARAFVRTARAEYPYTVEHAEVHFSGAAQASEFEIGLDLVLESLERLRRKESAERQRRT